MTTIPLKNKLSQYFFISVCCSLVACTDTTPSVPLSVDDYPESHSAPATLYLLKCGGCHAAPLPSIHTERQWLSVVQRMQLRMTSKAMAVLDKQEMETIVGYLQKHARKE